MRKNIENKKVYIRSNPDEWGIVTAQVDNDLFVAMFGDEKEQRLFERDEVKVSER